MYLELEICSNFLKFCFWLETPGKVPGKKAFLRENISCYISEMEGCRKLKFGEVNLQICQIFMKEYRVKNFWPEFALRVSLAKIKNKTKKLRFIWIII